MDEITFTIDVPASKKNRPMIWRPGQGTRPIIVPSKEAQRDEKAIKELTERLAGDAAPIFGDDDVVCSICYRASAGKVDVTFKRLRPRPKGFTGRRRDISNIPDAILDGSQGAIYHNDNQVAELHIWRELV